LGLLFLASFSGIFTPTRRDHCGSSGSAGPALTALVLLLWHLGLQSPDSTDWCAGILKAIETASGCGGGAPLPEHVDHHAAVGLVLLDDVIRTIFRFVAATPAQAWPFALINRKHNFLWIHDEEWWEACYSSCSWLRLPPNPKTLGLPQAPDSLWCPLREARLWASVMVETLWVMAILPPRCASPSWAATPCVASTLLVVSCAPWLPRRSEMVLFEMRRLMRTVGRFTLYFQAVWIVALAVLFDPEDVQLCALPKASGLLRTVEVIALLVLCATLAEQIWVVCARCRASSPLYAVPAEDVVSDPPLRNRPLYCGSLGHVEGTHAPTRMCDWEELGMAKGRIRWRSRYSLRRCAETLAAREAHLLSNLDALELRIREAEIEANRVLPTSSRAGLLALLHLVPAVVASVLLFSLASANGWQLNEVDSANAGPTTGSSTLDALIWAAFLIRVGHCWYSIMVHSAAGWDASGHAPHGEAVELRQQALALHKSIAQTQKMLVRLEDGLGNLGVAVQQPHGRADWRFSSAAPAANGPWRAFGVFFLCWLSCAVAFVLALSDTNGCHHDTSIPRSHLHTSRISSPGPV